jgi:O-Antigen ligase
MKKDTVLSIAYVLSFLVFLRLSAWGGGFNSLYSLDVVSISKISIRLTTFAIALLYLLKYAKLFFPFVRGPYIQLLLFLGVGSISLIYTSDLFYSGYRLVEHVGYLVFSLVIVINISRSSVSSKEVIKRGVDLVYYGVGLLILVVWMTFFIAPEYAFRHLVGDIVGFGGSMLHVHTLANIACLAFGISLHRLLSFESKNRLYNYIVPVAMVLTVILTRSRSGIVILVALSVMILVFHRKKKSAVFIFTMVFSFVCVLLVDNAKGIFGYLLREQELEDLLRLTERTRFWEALIVDTWHQNPFLGYGYQMLSENGIVKDFPNYGYSISNAHNTFVQTFVGLGLVGLMLLLYQLLKTFKVLGIIYMKAARQERDSVFELLIIVFVCLVSSLAQYGIVGMTTPIVPAYMMAVTLITYQWRRLIDDSRQRNALLCKERRQSP